MHNYCQQLGLDQCPACYNAGPEHTVIRGCWVHQYLSILTAQNRRDNILYVINNLRLGPITQRVYGIQYLLAATALCENVKDVDWNKYKVLL